MENPIITQIKNICGGLPGIPELPAPKTRGPFSPLLKSSPRSASSASITVAPKAHELVALGDFNRDGVGDSAVITSSGITVNLYNADGTTLSSAFYPVPGIGPSLLAADFNGDGFADLAATETDASGQGNVVVLLGKGDGTFQAPAKFPAGMYAYYLATADFNGDGSTDLAVTNNSIGSASTVSVLLNQGNGSFSSPVSYTVGNFPGTILAADFNGDGKVDLVALDNVTGIAYVNKVWVLLGKGDGTFQPAVSTATGTGSGYLACADLNSDGKLDLIIADEFASAMAIMMGNGDGTFQAANEYVAASQAVSLAILSFGDGSTSLLTADNLSSGLFLFYVASDGFVAIPQLQYIGSGPTSIATADLNGDGHPDLAITDAEAGNIYVKLGTGSGNFASPVTYSLGTQPGALALADLNGDGNIDVIAADVAGIDVLLGSGNGTLGAVNTFPANGSLSSIAIADFNGDGKPDVAAASSAGGVLVYLGNGRGAFQPAKNVALAGGLVALSAVSGDLNGDGKPDLIVAFNNSDQTQPGGVAVLLGKGDGTFQAPVNIMLPGPLVQQATGSTASAALTLGDLNGDGKLDVVTAFQGSPNQVAVLLGDGKGGFQAPLLSNTNTGPPMIAITDLNGDGKPDLLLADCCGLSEASMLLGKGDGTFQPEMQFPSGPNPRGIAVGDFYGQGLPNLAVIGQLQRPDRGTLVLFNAFWSAPPTPQATVVSAANSEAPAIAPGSLATAYGSDLANGTPGATSLPLPTSFGGTSVSIVDSSGATSPAPLLYVKSTQVNFEIPPGVATGAAQIVVNSSDGTQSVANVQIAAVAPGVFELNSDGLAAAYVILYHADNTKTVEQVYTVSGGDIVATPVSLGSSTDEAYLFLFGTGLQAAGTSGVTVSVGGTNLDVKYAGTQGSFAGLDQVNAVLPHSLAGSGNVTVLLTALGVAANAVQLTIQ